MTPPLEPHWVCETCGKPYAAQPIACECGAREFVALTLDVGEGTRVGVETKPARELMCWDCMGRGNAFGVPCWPCGGKGKR